jgi:hypothetical protein
MQALGSALPDLAVHGAIGGGFRCLGSNSYIGSYHQNDADLSASLHEPATRFIHGGSGVTAGNSY